MWREQGGSARTIRGGITGKAADSLPNLWA